jgi:DNA polymerase-3 subunit beta
MQTESKIQAKVKKDALMQALGRISVYTTGNKQPAVKLVFSENTLKISANSPFGNMEEEIDAEIQGEGSLKIAFNANYLADTVKAIMMEDVIFKMGTSVSPVVVNDGETEKIELILPVRVYEAEEAA